jgi:hypothetical protein
MSPGPRRRMLYRRRRAGTQMHPLQADMSRRHNSDTAARRFDCCKCRAHTCPPPHPHPPNQSQPMSGRATDKHNSDDCAHRSQAACPSAPMALPIAPAQTHTTGFERWRERRTAEQEREVHVHGVHTLAPALLTDPARHCKQPADGGGPEHVPTHADNNKQRSHMPFASEAG